MDYRFHVVLNGADSETKAFVRSLDLLGLEVFESTERLFPGAARNLGLVNVQTEWIYFIDDDAFIDENFFSTSKLFLCDSALGFFGGPNISPQNDSFFSKMTQSCFENPLICFGPSKRYIQKNRVVEPATESSMILCNFFLRSSQVGTHERTFDPNLKGGEENLLVQNLINAGQKGIFSSDLFVRHERRSGLLDFCQQVKTYGAGRGQLAIDHNRFSIYNLAPFIFFLIPVLLTTSHFFEALLMYIAYCAVSALIAFERKRKIFVLLSIFLFPFLHFFYTLGMTHAYLRFRAVNMIKNFFIIPILLALIYWSCFAEANNTRAIPNEFFDEKAICYSPFRSNDLFSEEIEKGKILEDLKNLSRANFKIIRIFSSNSKLANKVLEVITENSLNFKVFLGLYIQSHNERHSPDELSYIKELNQNEIRSAVSLANNYKETILAVSVGNQNLSSWSNNLTPVGELSRYITQVRKQIQQPITTDESWSYYAKASKKFLSQLDFLAVHSYPFVDLKSNPSLLKSAHKNYDLNNINHQLIESSIQSFDDQLSKVRKHLQNKQLSQLPIIVGETGWKAVPTDGESKYATPFLQKLYFDGLETYRLNYRNHINKKFNIFYFIAFDEPWKKGDDGWGFFDVMRQPRLVVQDHFYLTGKPSPQSELTSSTDKSDSVIISGYISSKNRPEDLFIFALVSFGTLLLFYRLGKKKWSN